MHIAMLSWESLYSVRVGGIAPHVTELSEALSKRGHEVHIITRRGNFHSYDIINGVHYQRVDANGPGDLLAMMRSMNLAMLDRFDAVQGLFGKFDIVHGHDWHPVLALESIKVNHGLPYIITMHSTEWGRCGNNFGDARISHMEWLGSDGSDRIVVTTEKMKREIVQLYSADETKINVIPNGIVVGKINRAVDKEIIRVRYGVSPGAPLILFCGRMSYQKGPDLLVEAVPATIKEHQDAIFIFAGEGEMRAFCEEKARQLEISNSCRFLGYVSPYTKEELINACDLFCVPSRNEPFGMVVLEAWDAKKPVVATEAVSIINNFQDGLLAYIEPASLSWCMKRLLENPKESRALAEAGNRRLKAEFSWDNIAEDLETAYEEVLNQPQTRSN
jgi:glycosyltransferase involved in cell wall biosynthesis